MTHNVDPEFFAAAPPRPARWGPGRLLRVATGVNEDILAAVPSERARYTSMGGVVLGTTLMAMLSMSVALYSVFGGFQPLIAVAVPIWGLFILNLDRWLISSPPGTGGLGMRKLVPRVLLSVILGVIVAEPLLLGIYHTAIEERIVRDRRTELVDRGSDLRQCNPVPGTPEASVALPAKCGALKLPIQGASPEALASKRDGIADQVVKLKQTVDADTKQYADLEEKARQECNGTSGNGLTGKYGDGVNCERLRAEASRFHADHRIDDNEAQLAVLNGQLDTASAQYADAQNSYKAAIDDAIAKDLQSVRDRQGRIGILERFRALAALVSENGYVGVTEWALRIMFVAIDALPVILKVLNGVTPYDRMVAGTVADQEEVRRMRAEEEMENHRERGDLVRHELRAEAATRRERVDQDIRVRFANLEEHRGKLVDAYERHLMRAALGAAAESWESDSGTHVPYINVSDTATHPLAPVEPAADELP